MKRVVALLAAIAACQGMASVASAAPAADPDPVVDLKGVNHDKYARDLAECRVLADNAVSPTPPAAATPTGKVRSGVAGVAKAGVHAVTKNGLNVIQGANTFVKDVSGETAASRKHTITVNCLKGRGYAVLE